MTDVPADAVPQDVPTATSDPAAIITPAPEDPTLKPGYCSPVWACDDNYIICGGERIPYGGYISPHLNSPLPFVVRSNVGPVC